MELKISLDDRINKFEDKNLTITNNCFIFGKNGTGKSTITRLIKEQYSGKYDVRIFQGYRSVLSSNNELNAVILGEENVEIENKIEKINKENEKLNIKLQKKENDLLNKIDESSFAYKYNEIETKYKNTEKNIDKFYVESARYIKNIENPNISSSTYNKNDFSSDIKNARILSNDEVEFCKATLLQEYIQLKKIELIDFDIFKIINDVTNILREKVKPVISIRELDNDVKIKFAKDGLDIHRSGEVCSFCGNIISKERIESLEEYFSLSDIQSFEKKIKKQIEHINLCKNKVNLISCEKNNFPKKYKNEASNIVDGINLSKNRYIYALEDQNKRLDYKLKNIYTSIENEYLKEDDYFSLNNKINEYNELVKKNNDSDLITEKNVSKYQLRLREVGLALEKEEYKLLKLDYEANKNNFINLSLCKKEREKEIKEIKNEIEKNNKLIVDLKKKTMNEEILSNRINKDISLYFDFNLYSSNDVKNMNGVYKIRNKTDKDFRDVGTLSTGEKNAIAFLYFIYKLEELTDSMTQKIIVFDDPMNSNDDTIQYLMTEKLNMLLNESKKNKDLIIILTHNSHFYINLTYNLKGKNYSYVNIIKCGEKRKIVYAEKEQFKTSYEYFWKELDIIYKTRVINSSMLLNPIRRILETYSKFNCKDMRKDLKDVSGALKLFHVNSHSIDDLEAELNSLNKEDIMEIMRRCFIELGGKEHFDEYVEKYMEEYKSK